MLVLERVRDLVGDDAALEEPGQPVGQVERFPGGIVVAGDLLGVQAHDQVFEPGSRGDHPRVDEQRLVGLPLLRGHLVGERGARELGDGRLVADFEVDGADQREPADPGHLARNGARLGEQIRGR